jgi:hypothetical protein
MKCLNLSLLFILALSGCTSTLEQAGKNHALVFKKWQALSNYAGNTFTQIPILMVARLVVKQGSNGKEFVLQDFHLTDKESDFQINLRTPRFEDKYICNSECVYLTEYINKDAQNATILTRYFNKYEFGLFEFYGDVFSLKKSILAMQSVSNEHFDDYLQWIIIKGEHFNNLDEFTDYMRQSFNIQAYSQFIQNPNALYSQMITPSVITEESEISEVDKGSVPSEMMRWNMSSDFTAEETVTYKQNQGALPSEMVRWNFRPALTSNDDSILAIKDRLMFDFKLSTQVEAGDVVCNIQTNTFGQVIEVRGTELSVSMIGRLQLVKDGIVSQTITKDSFSSQYPKHYAKISGIQSFMADEIVVCDFNL